MPWSEGPASRAVIGRPLLKVPQAILAETRDDMSQFALAPHLAP